MKDKPASNWIPLVDGGFVNLALAVEVRAPHVEGRVRSRF